MRLGELKNILHYAVDDNGKIVVNATPVYGGQAYQIKNFLSVSNALTELKKHEWNNFDATGFINIKTKYDISGIFTITTQEYNALIQYINNINTKLPLFYSILSNMIEEQPEQLINIKLPEKDDFSLKELSDINTRLDRLFKEINIDGQYVFNGFDVGTSWYEILIIGSLTYKFFIFALKIAQEFFKTEKEFYESGKAKINYKAALLHFKDAEKKASEKDIEEYAKEVINIEINIKINNLVKELPSNGHSENEVITKMSKTVNAITAELHKGLEFHLSLNPPKYAEEDNGKISINYEEIRQIEVEKKAPKQITEKEKNINDKE
jgi:hypothetical protein